MTIDQTQGGWIPPQRAVRLLALLHPALGRRDRAAPERARPARAASSRRGGRRSRAGRRRRGRTGPQRPDDRERHDRLPRPAGEVVDRERRARREQDHLRRDRDDPLPRPLAEQRHEALREDAAARDAALAPDVVERLRGPASTPAIFSATYDSIVVERSAGPSHQFDQVPSSRRRARMSLARRRSVSGSRRPRTCSQKRCSAIIVAFDSSSPTHQPPGCWSSSRRCVAASTALVEPGQLLDGGHAVHRPRGGDAAPNRRLHRRRPVGGDPGAGEVRRSACEVRIVHRSLRVPGRAAKVARGSRLTRDQRSSAGPSRSVSASAIRSTRPSAADLEQVGHAARDDGQVLAAAGRLVAGQRAAVEHPVGRAVEQGGEPVARGSAGRRAGGR